MELLFALLFVMGIFFSAFMFITIFEDIKKRSKRPIYTISLAFAAWFMTLPALIATGGTQMVSYAAYNAVTYSSNTFTAANIVSVLAYPAYNVTTTYSSHITKSLLYTYLPFWVLVVGVNGIVLLLYYFNYFRQLSKEALGTQ